MRCQGLRRATWHGVRLELEPHCLWLPLAKVAFGNIWRVCPFHRWEAKAL